MPALIAALKDQNANVRGGAAEALGRIRPEAKEAVPALIVALKDQNENARSAAAEALGRIGPEAKEAAPALIAAALIAALKDQYANVRSAAAEALGRIRPETDDAVPALIAALKDQYTNVRSAAAEALGKMRLEAKEAAPVLIAALKDQNANVRSAAAEALGRIGPEADDAVPALIAALKDLYADVRRAAAEALGQMRPEAKEAAPALIAALKDQDENVRRAAAEALGRIGPEAKEAVPALIAALKDLYADVRSAAAEALGWIAPEAKEAAPALIAALKDQNENARGTVAEALGRIRPEAKEAALALIAALKERDSLEYSNLFPQGNSFAFPRIERSLVMIGLRVKEVEPILIAALKDQDAPVRSCAARALGQIRPAVDDAVPALIAMLKDEDANVRSSAAIGLGWIAIYLFDVRQTNSLNHLKSAYNALTVHSDPEARRQAIYVKRTVDYFESLWWVEARNRGIKAISDHPYIGLAVAAYLLLQLTWLLFFWLRPLLLLKVIIALSKSGEKYKIPKIEIPIPLKTALVFPFFHYRPRLLDAWVWHHLVISRENFAKKQTVAQRKVYVTMPALVDEQMREGISAAALQPIFDRKKVMLLIAGEGGAGKTSLACQMAIWAMADEPELRLCKTHRMLPVLIEANLSPRDDKKDVLVEAVRGQLGDLIGETEPIFEELLLEALRKRRVLVIVDSLSELDETTRKSVRPADADFTVAALVVTSRINENMGGVSKTILHTIRLKSDRLSTFMDRYLEQLGKRELFKDKEYFDACSRLSDIVSDRDITVLIAKMYAEQMVAAKEADASAWASGHDMPRNLPDLMLSYVNNLNEQVKSERQDIEKVIRAAKVVAWECLKYTCRPTTAKRADVLKTLSDEADAETLLKYLNGRLHVIQTAGPISDLVRFSLDPLAEYLAAFYLVERCREFEDLWKEFFDIAEKQPEAPETIKGFLLAVRDCCLEKGIDYNVPGWVGDKLARFAGLDEEAIKTVQLRQRVKLLLANLSSPDDGDRIRAAVSLGQIGPQATDAVPALISTLKHRNANVSVTAATALWRIGQGGKEVVLALIAAINDQDGFVRKSAAEALGKFGLEAKEAVPALIAALQDQDVSVRFSASVALGEIGPEAQEAMPALNSALNDPIEYVRKAAAVALKKIEHSEFVTGDIS